jgi:Protein of unknown function (DUF3795)
MELCVFFLLCYEYAAFCFHPKFLKFIITMIPQPALHENLIAPCGMNCALCAGYLARLNKVKEKGIDMPSCAGCRPRGKKCALLKTRCDLLLNRTVKYCYECHDFPCKNLRAIDARYRSHYNMSLVGNLNEIRRSGLAEFLRREEKKWVCPTCGGMICCHNGLCFACDLKRLKAKKQRYRWEEERH